MAVHASVEVEIVVVAGTDLVRVKGVVVREGGQIGRIQDFLDFSVHLETNLTN